MNEPFTSTDMNSEIPENKTPVLMVALYLVLLAFFILLNSLAFTDQQRSEEAIRSVNASFNAKSQGAFLLTKTPKPLSMDIVLSRQKDYLKQLALDYVKSDSLEVLQDGNVLYITMDPGALFLDGRSLIRDDKRAFLKHLALSVYPGVPGVKTKVQIISTSRHYLSDSLETEKKTELFRVGALARYFTTNRVPGDQIQTGITTGKENKITFRFELLNQNQ